MKSFEANRFKEINELTFDEKVKLLESNNFEIAFEVSKVYDISLDTSIEEIIQNYDLSYLTADYAEMVDVKYFEIVNMEDYYLIKP